MDKREEAVDPSFSADTNSLFLRQICSMFEIRIWISGWHH